MCGQIEMLSTVEVLLMYFCNDRRDYDLLMFKNRRGAELISPNEAADHLIGLFVIDVNVIISQTSC